MSRRALGRRSSAELPSVSVGSRISADTSTAPALADHVHPSIYAMAFAHRAIAMPTSFLRLYSDDSHVSVSRHRPGATRDPCQLPRRSVTCSLSHEPTFLPLHLARAALGRRFRTAVGNGNVLQVGTRWLLAGVARWYSAWSKWWCPCGAHIHTTSRCVTWEAEWDVDPRGIGVNTNVPYGGHK